MNAWRRLAEAEPALFAELRSLDTLQRQKAVEELRGELPAIQRKMEVASLAIEALTEEV